MVLKYTVGTTVTTESKFKWTNSIYSIQRQTFGGC